MFVSGSIVVLQALVAPEVDLFYRFSKGKLSNSDNHHGVIQTWITNPGPLYTFLKFFKNYIFFIYDDFVLFSTDFLQICFINFFLQ